MSKVNVKLEDGIINIGVDLNEDNENSLVGKLHISEAIEEAIKRSEPVEGAKLVTFGFNEGKLVLALDTDKDGEKLFELELDIMEVIDEASMLIKK